MSCFQIQPIKCPIQNNEVSTHLSWCVRDYSVTYQWIVKLKPLVLSHAGRFKKNWILCCTFCTWSLVCFVHEKKSCVRMSLWGFESTTQTKVRLNFRWRWYFNTLITQKGSSNSEMNSSWDSERDSFSENCRQQERNLFCKKCQNL